ncbi:glycerol-3-phosphate 1-O-acyltransferase PlsY [Mycoplasma sp. Mirounga ES2805-ORL]|uniref:glycerol-3-phosphate 1-O-acyltransferase PlsY n=1 Tax=Mycoplasma sp. Mirounga ES2805-ORL TaxID=754514 RepID=UPI00197C71C4|nr:glycerol-3-phosphate 1-O-acyltransferase PlsY [Mycoplasma sp. Mirounga ES2805-ORL]QSF13699.1 glycerol-3-phosphate acyltransferase [Mycoplasma sp. Mirounga ES2805-ORL]
MEIIYIFLLNFALFLIGYLFFGSLNTSIIVSKKKMRDDIRKHCSKNAGATNALRVYGKKIAGLIFAIDVLKTFVPVLIVAILNRYAYQEFANKYFMSPQALGLGVVIGHIFPIYFKFKGGKGIACSVGFIATINVVIFVIAAIIWLTVFFITRYVSLAGIITTLILIPLTFFPWVTQGILGFFMNSVEHTESLKPCCLSRYWYVSGILFFIDSIVIIFAHRSNIKRLINHNESKLKL